MKQELQNKLVEKYPKIFAEVGSTPQQSCMAFGICVDDGWYWIIDKLCQSLQFNINNNGHPQVVAAQIKEKFGTLRFYVNHASEAQYEVIHFVESLTYDICEECGTTKDVSQDKGLWVKTLCNSCRENREKEAKKRIEECDKLK